MHDSNGRTTYTYDDVQRMRTVVNPANKKLTYSYDAIGQRRSLIEPEGGRFTTSYDDGGRIRFLVNPQNYRTSWTYDAADRVKVRYLGNSTRVSYSYNDGDWLLKLANIRTDATTISSFDYAYDSVGNRTRVVESDGIRVSWTYDTKYQLTRECRNGANAYDITYSYDAAGNRRFKLEDSIHTTYMYDAANELRYHEDNTGRTTYTFDANGNQRIMKAPTGALTTNTWDYEDKLTKVILSSGTRNTFAYDADGKRVKKEDSSGTSNFVWDHENILVETNAADTIQAVYSLEPVIYGNLVSQYRSATTSFFHFDALGATERLTNTIGTVTDRHLYTAFGTITLSSGSTINRFKFVGYLGYFFDADVSLYLLRARFYYPALGRFPSRDPIGLNYYTSPYVYLANSPTSSTDPSGMFRYSACCTYTRFCCSKFLTQYTETYGPINKTCTAKSGVRDAVACCKSHTPSTFDWLHCRSWGPSVPEHLGFCGGTYPGLAPSTKCQHAINNWLLAMVKGNEDGIRLECLEMCKQCAPPGSSALCAETYC